LHEYLIGNGPGRPHVSATVWPCVRGRSSQRGYVIATSSLRLLIYIAIVCVCVCVRVWYLLSLGLEDTPVHSCLRRTTV